MIRSGAFLIRKRLRQRFGIRARKVTVRTHVPWYLWGVIFAVALALSLGLGAWVYDTGRRLAGFDSSVSQQEITALKARSIELLAEVVRLQQIVDTGGSQLQIERTAGQQLARQAKMLEQENASLREDLSFFEGLVPGGDDAKESGPTISRLRVEPDLATGQYRYRMLIVQRGAKSGAVFRGGLQLVVKYQQSGKDAMILLPAEGGGAEPRYRLEIKYFQRAEGVIAVPPGARLKSVEARLLQNGVIHAKRIISL